MTLDELETRDPAQREHDLMLRLPQLILQRLSLRHILHDDFENFCALPFVAHAATAEPHGVVAGEPIGDAEASERVAGDGDIGTRFPLPAPKVRVPADEHGGERVAATARAALGRVPARAPGRLGGRAWAGRTAGPG